MRTAAILATLLAAAASPALAQHEGHPMPLASPPPATKTPPKPKHGPRPAPTPAAKPPVAAAPAQPPMPPMPMPAPAEAPDDASAVAPAMDGPAKTSEEDPASDSMAEMPVMEGMDLGSSDEAVGDEPPPPAPTDFAADRVFDPATMARARLALRAEHGGTTISTVLLNVGEYQFRAGENGYRWDGEAWFGGDLNRLVIKSEGESGIDSGVEAADVQALYSRAIGPFFDLQAGLRQDLQQGPKRTYATVGFEGVAPYWFETSGALFLSSKGELLGRLEGTYDLRLTQRWILQPRVETNLSGQDIPELGLGSGVSNIELGVRLRYEIKREFAPYVGVSFDRTLGGTADYARALGKGVESTSFVMGVRAWF